MLFPSETPLDADLLKPVAKSCNATKLRLIESLLGNGMKRPAHALNHVLVFLLALVMAGCTSIPLAVNEVALYRADENTIDVPGILPFAKERGAERITVFGIHGMGKTSPCYSAAVAAMLSRGRAGNTAGRGDSCRLIDATVMPVCLEGGFDVTGEGLHDGETIVIGDECRTGDAFDIERLYPEKSSVDSQRARRLYRFGLLAAYSFRVSYRDGSRPGVPVRYYAYWWQGDAEYLQLPYIREDLSEAYENERVTINKAIKRGVINDGLSDAALYLGSGGELMRDGTRNALCLMVLHLTGRVNGGAAVAAPCMRLRLTDGDAISDLGGSNIVLLTQSLGSRILFDSLDRFSSDNSKITADQAASIGQTILRNGPLVYMSANQLPLLGVSQISVTPFAPKRSGFRAAPAPAPAGGFFRQLLDRVEPAPADEEVIPSLAARSLGIEAASARDREPRIIAFYDPNDLLGYRAGDHLSDGDRKRIIEVTQRYAPPWIIFADPIAAHDASFDNDRGQQLVMCGAHRPSKDSQSIRINDECRG